MTWRAPSDCSGKVNYTSQQMMFLSYRFQCYCGDINEETTWSDRGCVAAVSFLTPSHYSQNKSLRSQSAVCSRSRDALMSCRTQLIWWCKKFSLTMWVKKKKHKSVSDCCCWLFLHSLSRKSIKVED